MESIIYVGIDVHKDTYSACCYQPDRNLIFAQTEMKAEPENVVKYLRKIESMNEGSAFMCGYEAGPTGLKLCRFLQKQDYPCAVMAPTSIAKTTRDKVVKTDRSDAVMLAKSLAFHSYKEVVLPTEEMEAIREVVRMRNAVRKQCKRAKQQYLSFLLCQGFTYPFGGADTYWSKKFFEWLKTVRFNSAELQFCKEELEAEAVRMMQRVKELDKKIRQLAEKEEIRDDVNRLKCICGIDVLTAVTLKAEVGDFNRFRTAKDFASYTGLCPGKHSSGLSDFSTRITKQGNRTIRKLLTESAKAIRRSGPRKSYVLMKRQAGMDSRVVDYADKASKRIRMRLLHFDARGKHYNKSSTAAARELSCFVWGMMTGNMN